MAETKAEVEAERDALKAQIEAQGESGDRTIFQRILAIANEVGVLEAKSSGGVPFAFRGIDATVAHLTPLLNKHEVFVVPTKAEQFISQRDVGNKVVSKAEVLITYRFYGPDGTFLEAQVPAQADDFADRSSAQAMSVALRILLLQTFHIAAFGNEEAASEDTKNARETAASAKVDRARGASAPAAPSAAVDPAAQMRQAIVAQAGLKGWDGDAINEFARKVTGKADAEWFGDPDSLNLILSKINEAK